jgi:hypothetical protein
MTMTDKLEAQIAALKAEMEELKRAKAPPDLKTLVDAASTPPPNPFRHIDQQGMSKETMAEMVRAVGSETIRGIVKSGGVGVLQSTATTPTPTPVSAQNTSGWREATPLGPPPGINHVDRLCEVADARDRAELIAKEAQRLAPAKK